MSSTSEGIHGVVLNTMLQGSLKRVEMARQQHNPGLTMQHRLDTTGPVKLV